jgi:dTMP kinase
VRGRFVAFEGGEGCGKSTQARLLAERLGAVLTHEPGATELGRRVRTLVLGPAVGSATVDARAEALLMAADRAQHVAEVVRPALEKGLDVVTDRFSGSTLAYQGYGRGLPLDDLRWLTRWASGGLEPDAVVLSEGPVEGPRTRARPRPGEGPDRMEGEDREFHRRVESGYRSLAAADPDRWAVVDGAGDVDEVAARVAGALGL